QALLELNAAWQVWEGRSNASRGCSEWDYITCNQRGFVTSLDLSEYAMVNSTMPLTLFSRMPDLRRLVLASNIFLHGSITQLALPTSLRVL
ncbi:unnamed protein product, partial [Closterium sp. Yama58-4]